MRRRPTRREFGAGLALAGIVGLRWGPAIAQTKEVRVAMIAPLSGPWARQGQLMRMGADMAIGEINEKGGIKSLGGAKLTLVVADAGDAPRRRKMPRSGCSPRTPISSAALAPGSARSRWRSPK